MTTCSACEEVLESTALQVKCGEEDIMVYLDIVRINHDGRDNLKQEMYLCINPTNECIEARKSFFVKILKKEDKYNVA